jgi:DGQHR domain-containing protein
MSGGGMYDFGIRVPAIRGRQGKRTFYVTSLPNEFLRNIFKDVQPAAEKSQRPIDPKHSHAIQDYIRFNRADYLIGALTYAMDSEGTFTELGVGKNTDFALGELSIPLEASFSSLDGQHRRQALIDLLEEFPDLKDETTAVLIYVEPDIAKKRQMFSDMNSTPKKVSKSLNVAFDSRDPFARGAKLLIKKHPMLLNRVEEMAPRVKADSNYFFSLSAVQDTLKKLFVGSAGRVKEPGKYTEKIVLKRGNDFFNILLSARPEYLEALDNAKSLEINRKQTILFSSTTLRAIAGAVHKALNYYGAEDLTEIENQVDAALREVDFSTTSKMFIKAGFIKKGSSTPSARNQEIMAATNAIFELMKDESQVALDQVKTRSNSRIKIREQ